MNGKIVGIGEILWDMLPSGKQLGGAPANFAYHVCRLGGDGWAVSAIGRDGLGQEIKDVLKCKRLNTCLAELNLPTGTVQVTLDTKGVPNYNITESVAWDSIPYSDHLSEIASETSAVCFGTLAQRSAVSRETIRRFIGSMPKDSLKVYDINLRQHYYDLPLIKSSLELADVLKINDEELKTVTDLFSLSGSCPEICRSLIKLFDMRFVILTKGENGSDVITLDTVHSIMPDRFDIVDTVGAGDAFTAAFIVSYLRGDSLEVAHKRAGEAASYVCARSGAMPE